ncbi:MAG: FecR domain-containing protein [Ilumatobacteraceae bacterium]
MEYGKTRLQWLFEKYLDNTCTAEEKAAFFELVDNPEYQESVQDLLKSVTDTSVADRIMTKERADSLFAAVMATTSETTPVIQPGESGFSWRKLGIAASVILLIGASCFWVLQAGNNKSGKLTSSAPPKRPTIFPGHDNAILKLANGSTVVLDSVGNGSLATQGKISVTKLDGQIKYDGASDNPGDLLYNTVSTARGNQYQLVLSDGTRVWLNAASSLQFPVAFERNERKVSMKGEVYFEIAADKSRPFIVNVNGMEVTVLGTHFDVNAYTDEKGIKTTLLEGAVKISKEKVNTVMVPGQQAMLSDNGSIRLTNNVDVDEIVAWKNGSFVFTAQPIESIMRQISRWYDVDIVYEGPVSKETFSGIVSRKSNLSEALKIMEDGGVKFRIENRKIVVMQ